MKKILPSLLLFLTATTGFCTTWTITNSGFTFNPNSITITLGDNVNFTLGSIHNAVEVTQATWNANGSTALTGGFQVPFSGGLVQSSQLGVGTHYYVCQPHATGGMKGIIIVQNATSISENQLKPNFNVYPNPSGNLVTIKASNNIMGSQYYITDQTGRQIFNGKIVDEDTPVDISQLKPGIYLIQIVGQRKQFIKVIKN